jgi:hypothetical protein
MELRLAEIFDLGEKRLDEFLNAAVAVAAFWPIVPDEDDFVGNGLDLCPAGIRSG